MARQGRYLITVLDRAISATHFKKFLFPQHLPIQLRIDVTLMDLSGNDMGKVFCVSSLFQ